MRRLVIAAVVLVAAGIAGWQGLRWLVLPAPAATAALDPAHARIAIDFLDRLDRKSYDDALAMLEPKAREALSSGKLQEVWEALPAQLGGAPTRGPARGESVGGRPIVTFRLDYPTMPLDARVAVDAAGLIDGFRVVPAAAAPAPPPASDAAYTERELAVASTFGPLPGTLTLPRGMGPFPAVVFVHGSGPHDRDETIGPNRPFLDLARGLAERGVASLRYVKRTSAHRERFLATDFTIDDETVDDAVAAVALLRTTDDIDPARVFVAGHSLGAMMAPRIAERAPAVAGLILLAAPALPLHETVARQVRYLAELDGGVDAKEADAIAEVERGIAAVAALEPGDTGVYLLELPAAYWLALNAYDPVEVARRLPQPLLVLQGARDYQVVERDFARWRDTFGTDPRVQFVNYPALNHLFIAGEGPGRPEEYFQPGHVDSRVVEDIAQWILAAGKAH